MKHMNIVIFENMIMIEDNKYLDLVLDLLIKHDLQLDVTKRSNDFTVSGKTNELYRLMYYLTEYNLIHLL